MRDSVEVTHETHNLDHVGSNPTPATKVVPVQRPEEMP